MYAHAIAQVEPPDVGIHLIWTGPRQWVYSQKGWWIQRRKYSRQDERFECRELNAAGIANLRITREVLWEFGTLILRDGLWPQPVTADAGGNDFACDVFRLDFAELQHRVQVRVIGKLIFAFALREENVVALSEVLSGDVTFELNALAIDAVEVYVLAPEFVRFCIAVSFENEEESWAGAPFIVQELQLPLEELMSNLNGPAGELAEATSRLLPGESLDPEEFKRWATTMRAGVKQAGPPRPLDLVLLTREELQANFEEMVALDPLRVLVSHPKWRRVLGFGWFDNDPTLVEGFVYQYRITGYFPAEDLHDTVYGFHSVPSQTLLPAEFFLHDLRIRLSEPVAVQRAPDALEDGFLQVTRRGIPIQPRQRPWWVLNHIQLEDWSLVIDFPQPVTSVVLELYHKHQLEWAAFSVNGFVAADSVPQGTLPLLTFPEPIEQLRFHGDGFLFAVRVPSGESGLIPVSKVLPPVMLKNTPRPEPPLWATLENLQQPQPQPEATDIPPATLQRRPALGFEISWRPALRDGLTIWPADADSAPPLDASIFQIEHRQEVRLSTLTSEVAAAARGAERLEGRPQSIAATMQSRLVERLQQRKLSDTERALLLRALAKGDTESISRLGFLPSTMWTPILPEENWVMGDRNEAETDKRVFQGADLMEVFPEAPNRGTGASLDLHWRDVFDFEEGGNVVNRPVPNPGTFHRYRVRTIDAIGRPSDQWVETNSKRLEKHVPPPVPAGPDFIPAEDRAVPAPTGVQARVLVQGAPGLTADDLALLGTDANVTVLRWGWHAPQREQDQFATEFRVYATTQPLDVIAGTISTFTPLSLGIYDVTIQLARPVLEDAAVGLTLDAPYPFQIYSHTAGSAITATIGTRVPKPDGTFHEPAIGPVQFNIHLTPDLTRPPAWAERVEIQPVTNATAYSAIMRNRLTLTAEHPRDALWVGVSCADDQIYVPDQLAPTENRPGNESAIVPVLCEARYHGRPTFDIPPALEPVDVIIAPEPAERDVTFALNLTPYFNTGTFGAGERMQPERIAANTVFTSYYATADNRVMARVIDARNAGETDQEVTVPNPGDRAAIISALNGARVDALADHYVVFLAGSHPYRDRLFEATSMNPIALGPFTEVLPPRGERYAYRIRKADAAHHLSAGGAMVKAVVRVPSRIGGPVPLKAASVAGDPPQMLRLQIGPDPLVNHLLTFSRVAAGPATNGSQPATGASILRVPNRPDLYPNDGIRLRTPEGAFLSPTVKSLADADVTVDARGYRQVALTFAVNPGQRLQVWACTLTRDGVPSMLAGPWGLAAPAPPLPVPALSITPIAPDLFFSWVWPAPNGFHDIDQLEVALERTADGSSWTRFSALMDAATTNYVHTPLAGDWQYRIVVRHPSGRTAHGAPVSP